MRINRIEYTNYRGLGTGSIEFENNLTMIVGKNGAGKTSILNAVAIAISWIVARLKSEKANGLYIDELSITNGQNHALIKAYFDDFQKLEIPNKGKKGITKKFVLNIDDMKEYVSAKRAAYEETNFMTSTPVFAFYGVKRAVVDIPLRARDSEFSLMNTYDDCLNGKANFRNFFTWFRNQEDLENEYKTREANNAYTSRELDAVRRALAVFMPEYRNIHVKRKPLRMVVEKQNKVLNVAQLSDGEKIFFALIGDLCQRLVLANPTLEDPLDGEGIVLIDEMDLHLHPEWQGTLAYSLSKVFRNVQFIVTTHSPHAINRIGSDSIRILQNSQISGANYSFGMPSLVVLKDIMELSHDEPQEIEVMRDSLYKDITESNIEAAKDKLSELENLVPDYPELVRMRKLIERLERKR